MTFFLDQAEPKPVPANNPRGEIPEWMDGFLARVGKAQMENDANFLAARTQRNINLERTDPVARNIGIERLNERYSRDGAGYDHLRPAPKTIEEFYAMHGDKEAGRIVKEIAGEDPDVLGETDLSEEGIEEETNARLRADYEELQQIIEMTPDAGLLQEFAAGMIGVTADVKNLPFLVMGGGSGSFLRVMGREAMINAGAELAFLPSQFEMAERLDIPDPSVTEQIATAAGAGAVFGGVVESLRRGLGYYKGRQSMPPETPPQQQAFVDEIEDAIVEGASLEELQQSAEAQGPQELPPLVLRPEERTDLPEIDLADEFPEMRFKYPLGRQIQQLGGVRRRDADGNLTPLAEELEAAGVTPRTHPWLFRKNGLSELDNIEPGRIEGLSEVLPVDGPYFARQGLVDALARELSTGRKTPLTGAVRARMDEIEAMRTPAMVDYEKMEPRDGVLFIDRDTYALEPDPDTAIRREVQGWMDEQGYSGVLEPREREEIIRALQENGGDAEYLVERFLEREIEFASRPIDEVQDDVPWPEPISSQEAPVGRGGAPVRGPEPDAEAAGRSGEGQGNDRRALSEATDAGDQILFDGVAPITQADRLRQQMEGPMRGGDAAADIGLFDTNARNQSDLFDDPVSKDARVIQDSVTADIRDRIEAGDELKVDVQDGKGARSMASVLDELDRDDEFLDQIDLCGKPRVTE